MVDVLPNPDDSGKDLGVFAIADALPQTFDPAGNNTRSRRCASRTPGRGWRDVYECVYRPFTTRAQTSSNPSCGAGGSQGEGHRRGPESRAGVMTGGQERTGGFLSLPPD